MIFELFLVSIKEKINLNKVFNISWYGIYLGIFDWNVGFRILVFSLKYLESGEYFYIMLNVYWKFLMFELLFLERGENWYLIVNIVFIFFKDFNNFDVVIKVIGVRYCLEFWVVVILMIKRD